MKLRFVFALMVAGFSSSALAGPFNDKLAVCLVKSTTETDRALLMRWMFAAMASHPKGRKEEKGDATLKGKSGTALGQVHIPYSWLERLQFKSLHDPEMLDICRC